MKVFLDEEKFFTGDYAIAGGGTESEGWYEVSSFPPYEEYERQLACKLINGSWVFFETKYLSILDNVKPIELTTEERLGRIDEAIDSLQELYAEVLMELA